MIQFKVEDMTCGGCAASITRAIKAVDGAALVEVDLPRHLVRVEPGSSSAGQIEGAIRDAGFTPAAST